MNALTKLAPLGGLLQRVKPSYEAEARRFLDLAERDGMNLETMQRLVSDLDGEGKSASTINKHVAAMRAVVRTAMETMDLTDSQRWTLERALKEVPYRKRGKGDVRVTSDKIVHEDEYRTLLEHAADRNGLVLEFLWSTGCRISEVLGARLSDCKPENGHVNVRVLGKGQKERHVRIARELYDRIVETFAGGTWLFETAGGMPMDDRNFAHALYRLSAKYLDRKVSPHAFRHSAATRLIRQTGKLQAVSEYLGHSTTAITLDLYVHESLTDDDLGIGSEA